MEGIKQLEYVLIEMVVGRRVCPLKHFFMLDISVTGNFCVKKLSKHCKMIYCTTIYLFYVQILHNHIQTIELYYKESIIYPNTESWLGEVRSIPGVSLWTLLHVEEYFITS